MSRDCPSTPYCVPLVTESELGQFSVTNRHLAHPQGGLICKNVPDYPIYKDHSRSNLKAQLMGKYSKAFSIKKQFQSPNCQTCQGQSRTLKKIVFLGLFLRIIHEDLWNLFEKIGQLTTPSA